MDLNNYIKQIARDTYKKSDTLKRSQCRVTGYDTTRVNLYQLSDPDKTIFNIKSSVGGTEVSEGDTVWVYYWKHISDGYIFLNGKRTVGRFVNTSYNSESFLDYDCENFINFNNKYLNEGYNSFNGANYCTTYPTHKGLSCNIYSNHLIGTSNYIFAETDSKNSQVDIRQCNITGWRNVIHTNKLLYGYIYGHTNNITNLNSAFQSESLILIGGDNSIDYMRLEDCGAWGFYNEINQSDCTDSTISSNLLISGSKNKIINASYASEFNDNYISGISNELEHPAAGPLFDFSSNSIYGVNNSIYSPYTIYSSCIFGSGNRIHNSQYIGHINHCSIFGTNNNVTGEIDKVTIVGNGARVDGFSAAHNNVSIAFGNSTEENRYHNGMNLDKTSNLHVAGSVLSNGADYAEDWEWSDGNPQNEDRRGLFVTIDKSGLIKLANGDDEILGIVSSNPSVIGGGDNLEWHNKYLKDVFGDYIYEEIKTPITRKERRLIENSNSSEEQYEIIAEETGEYKTTKRLVLNPEFDESKEYIPRKDRPEHCYVAHLGKIVTVDNGTCVENGYATVGTNGVATRSDAKTRANVLKRIDDNHILVWWE